MSLNAEMPKPVRASSARQWIRLSIVYLFIPLVLFLCAGDVSWWQAWGYAFLIIIVGLGGRFLAERQHPGLLADRQDRNVVSSAKA